MPQHGKSLARVYKDATSKRAKAEEAQLAAGLDLLRTATEGQRS